MDTENYSVNDLLDNENFLRWVKQPTSELNCYWNNWKSADPQRAEILNQAKTIILAVDFQKTAPEDIKSERIFTRIEQTLNDDFDAPPQFPSNKARPRMTREKNGDKSTSSSHFFNSWRKTAAAFIGVLILCASSLYFLGKTKEKVYMTDFGETKLIELPDRSQVKLNGNSTLVLSSPWEDQEHREVWLVGEAFFSITPDPAGKKFLVHTSDQFNIEVLGTEFNVSYREENTRVVLSSGKIKLNVKEENQTRDLLMQPGEMVEYAPDTNEWEKSEVNPSKYTAWRNNRLIFDNTSLREIKTILETTYGVSVEIADDTILEKKIFGSAPSDDLDLLLKGLSKSLNHKITLQDKTVKIE